MVQCHFEIVYGTSRKEYVCKEKKAPGNSIQKYTVNYLHGVKTGSHLQNLVIPHNKSRKNIEAWFIHLYCVKARHWRLAPFSLEIWMYRINPDIRTVIECNCLHRSLTLTLYHKTRNYLVLYYCKCLIQFGSFKSLKKSFCFVLTIKFLFICKEIKTMASYMRQ